jgi:hypothetical protein
MSDFAKDLDGYVLATGIDVNGGEFGLKIFVKTDHKPDSKEECKAFYDAREAIQAAVMKESARLTPETHEKAAKERALILECFGSRALYVDEIPNGYCSRYCCAFEPWFIVTTPRGRIRIGWRKSVIHLEWTDSAIKGTAKDIFPNEEAWPGYETTQYDKVIHAHGYEAAKRYIARLMEAP